VRDEPDDVVVAESTCASEGTVDVLLECLDDPRVQSVLAIGRSPTGRSHPKLREDLRADSREINALAGA